MISVHSLLIPHGNPTVSAMQICKLQIINDGTGTGSNGNYDVLLYSRGEKPRVIKRGRIENWPRNSKPAWRLIAKAFAVLDLE